MSTSFLLEQDVTRSLHEVAQQLRVDSVRCSAAASSGHPTSSMSAADLMAVLLGRHLRYDFTEPDAPANDHLIFSKGHASPLYYSMLRAVGAIGEEEFLTYRKARSRLEGHPTPRLPWVDVATGSLGQGLPVGVGVALAGKSLDKLPYRVWVLCGDSELAEGSIWEAAEQASFSRLDNLTLIVDVNRLGQRGPTRHGWDTAAYAARFQAFGWHTQEIDGHDIEEIDRAFTVAAAHPGAPSVILAKTKKGRGVAAVEDKEGAHGKPVPDAEEAIRELGGVRDIRVRVEPPATPLPAPALPAQRVAPAAPWRPPAYEVGSMAATRTAFGEALAALGDVRPDVVVLDGEVSDSTRTAAFAKAHPERFFEFYIAEQQMLAAAVGMQVRGWVPFAATFAAFFTRAYDFVRMAAVSRADIRLVGSHSGASIGADGPSQMGLEDLAAMRAVHGSTVLCPCDANQAAALTALMADLSGVSYLRIARGDTPVIYPPGERFEVGGSRVLRSAPDDQVTLVATGVTVHEALAAADLLADDGVSARVIDAYSVKPVDAATLRAAARETGRIVTVEDHWPEGGLGDAVLSALAASGRPLPVVRKLAVRSMPGSATPEEQLQLTGIDMASIATAAAELVGMLSPGRGRRQGCDLRIGTGAAVNSAVRGRGEDVSTEELTGLQDALLNTETVEQFLHELAVLAVRTVGVDDELSCGMALRQRGRPTLATACSDPLASEADQAQRLSGDGPALHALRHGRAVNVRDTASASHWPRFCRQAVSLGIRSCYAAPLITDGQPVGAFVLYARAPGAFDPERARRADKFARHAAGALSLSLRMASCADQNDQLKSSIMTRAVIDQALGVIMATERCPQDKAFALLRSVSQNTNVKLRDLAATIVTRASGQPPKPTAPFEDG